MALAARRAMSATFGFRDQEQTESNMLVHMTNPLFGIVDFVGFVEYLTYSKVTLANVIAQLSECDMSYIGLRMSERETVLGPVGSGEAEKKGVFLFSDGTGAPSFRMAIPGIKESALDANQRDIDTADASVAAFLAEFNDGTGPQIVTPNGLTVDSPFAAYKQHRQSSKGRGRRTG